MISVPSDKFKKNYDKIFGSKSPLDMTFETFTEKFMGSELSEVGKAIMKTFEATRGDWKWRYPEDDFRPLPYPSFNPYLPMQQGSYSNEVGLHTNIRIMEILNEARRNGLIFDATSYRVHFEKQGANPDLSLTYLTLKGLFISREFVQTFFKSKDFPSNYYHRIGMVEDINDLLHYLEGFMRPRVMVMDDIEDEDAHWTLDEIKQLRAPKGDLEKGGLDIG